MLNQKYNYYDYLIKIKGIKDDEKEINSLSEDQNKNNHFFHHRNQNQEENNINDDISNNENKKIYKSPLKEKSIRSKKSSHKKDKEIARLKEELLLKEKQIEELQKQNEEANKKIEQLNEELISAQKKKKKYKKRNIKNIGSGSLSQEKYNIINKDNNNNMNINKFNKLFNEEEKKALSTLFKSDKDLNNFNNKISILEDRNTKIENELKEENNKLINELNEKNEEIEILKQKLNEKGINKDNNENEHKDKKNTIEHLKKEINLLKQHKFNILLMKKQVQVDYMDGKISYIDNSDYSQNQKKLLKKLSDEEKKKVIKLKKIKNNKE